MKDDSNEILSDLLCSWHRWARGYQHVGGINTSPMFRECKNGRQWDTVDEIIGGDIENSQMEALDHLIMALKDVYRTALQIQARNLHTGKSVWSSARLPADAGQRALILIEARLALTKKLQEAGIL
jgi:hypothetical protein